MRRSMVWCLVGIIVVAAASLAATIIAGNKPLLGLDLRGGVSVVLRPQGTVDNATLGQAVRIIQNRVDGLGVANSDVQRQGHDVVVELPGIKNSQNALKVLGTTATLYFRPVICEIAPQAKGPTVPTPTTTSAVCGSTKSSSIASTSPDQETEKGFVIVPAAPGSGLSTATRYVLGPADLSGKGVKTASESTDQTGSQYIVDLTFNSKGAAAFNKVAAIRNKSYSASDTSSEPLSSLEGIELDGQLESAPTIENSNFGDNVQISGAFTNKQAADLALELRYGSLPVRFTPQSVQTVSASIGSDSLRAGLAAGLGGIILVMIYMILYYRALGVVVLIGIGVGGSLLYSIITELSQTSSLALTLSGVTGIIVSVGITVDSYVVYFERLKDEVRAGRSIRQSTERSFKRAFRTVLTADFVSFLAALILYEFTVGDVKGFAFTLGLSTLLDVATAYLFIRPMVTLVGRRRTFTENRFLGVARGLGVGAEGTA